MHTARADTMTATTTIDMAATVTHRRANLATLAATTFVAQHNPIATAHMATPIAHKSSDHRISASAQQAHQLRTFRQLLLDNTVNKLGSGENAAATTVVAEAEDAGGVAEDVAEQPTRGISFRSLPALLHRNRWRA